MARDLITTNQAASLLEVGASTIKRWADEGRVQCLKTPGGHRRFYRSEMLALRGSGAAIEEGLTTARILEDLSGHATLGALMQMRSLHGSWWSVAGQLGFLLEQIGQDWYGGKLSVVQEHIISERLQRCLNTVSQSLPLSASAPVCLFVMATDDEHTLGLRLAELTAREAGWQSLWVGRKTPVHQLAAALADGSVHALAVSASRQCSNAAELAAQADLFGSIAMNANVPLILGGQGAWPQNPSYGVRIEDFASFRDLLRTSARA